jgi:hypothetical protein
LRNHFSKLNGLKTKRVAIETNGPCVLPLQDSSAKGVEDVKMLTSMPGKQIDGDQGDQIWETVQFAQFLFKN